MQYYRVTSFLLLCFWLLLPFANDAQGSASPYGSRAPISGGEEVYNPPAVFIDEAHVEPEGDNRFSGSFDVSNEATSAIGGLKYRITVLSPAPERTENSISPDNSLLYHREHAKDVFSLAPGEQKTVPFEFTAPQLPSGEYRLRIQIVTEQGRSLGWADRALTIDGSVRSFVELESETISLPEFPNEIIPALTGPNINPESPATLIATATNVFDSAVTVTPTLTVHPFSTERSAVSTTTTHPITLGSLQSRSISVPMTSPTAPGVYQIVLTLNDSEGTSLSTLADYRLVVRGVGADILSLRIEEMAIKGGEKMLVATDFTGPTDAETVVPAKLHIVIEDDNGIAGSFVSPENVELNDHVIQTMAHVTLDRDLEGQPRVSASLRDEDGTVLAEQTVHFDLPPNVIASLASEPKLSALSQSIVPYRVLVGFVGLGVALLMVGATIAYMRNNRRQFSTLVLVGASILIGFGVIAPGQAAINVFQSPFNTETYMCSLYKKFDGWCTVPGRLIEVFVNEPRHNNKSIQYDRSAVPLAFNVTYAGCDNVVNYADVKVLFDKKGGFHTGIYGTNTESIACGFRYGHDGGRHHDCRINRLAGGVEAHWQEVFSQRFITTCPVDPRGRHVFCKLNSHWGNASLDLSSLPAKAKGTTLQIRALWGVQHVAPQTFEQALNTRNATVVNVWIHFKDKDKKPGCPHGKCPKETPKPSTKPTPTATPSPSTKPTPTPVPSTSVTPTPWPEITPFPEYGDDKKSFRPDEVHESN